MQPPPRQPEPSKSDNQADSEHNMPQHSHASNVNLICGAGTHATHHVCAGEQCKWTAILNPYVYVYWHMGNNIPQVCSDQVPTCSSTVSVVCTGPGHAIYTSIPLLHTPCGQDAQYTKDIAPEKLLVNSQTPLVVSAIHNLLR